MGIFFTDSGYIKPFETNITFEHSFSYFAVPYGYFVMESYLPPILPFKIKNIEKINFKYLKIDNLTDLMNYLETYGNIDNKKFARNAKSKTIRVNYNWDQVYNYRLSMKKMMNNSPGILIYRAEPELIIKQNDYTTMVRGGIILYTDLGITVKSSPEKTLVFVRSLKNNLPVKGAVVSVLDIEKHKVRRVGVSDKRGIAEFDTPNGKIPLVAVQKGKQFSFNYGSEDSYYDEDGYYSYGSQNGANVTRYGSNYKFNRPELHSFTERYLYKPGETVYFKGIFRLRENDTWYIPPAMNPAVLSVKIRNSRSETLTNFTVTANNWGSFNFSYKLNKQAPTGYYQIQYAYRESQNDSRSWYISFRVEDYKPAKAEMKIKVLKPSYTWGNTFCAKLTGWHLFGAPVFSSIHYEADIAPVSYQSSHFPDYSFGTLWWEEGHRDYGFNLSRGTLFPSKSGTVEISRLLKKDNFIGDGILTLSASTTLDDKSTVYGIKTGIQVYNPHHIGIKSKNYFVNQNETAEIDLIALNPQDKIDSGFPVRLQIQKREWESVQKAGVNGRLEWEWIQIKTNIYTQDLSLGQKTVSLKIKEPGYYVARAKGFVRGHPVISEDSFYVIGSGSYGWKVDNNYEIELVSDKPSYSPGETAQILVKNPFKHATALISVEREKFHEIREVEISNSITTIPIKIKEDYIPNIYVSVMLYTGRSGTNRVVNDRDLARPSYRYGYINLKISKKNRQLKVNITMDQTKVKPGETIRTKVEVLDAKNKPVEAEVTLTAVDKGTLNLVSYRLPNPLNTFYGNRPLAITTSEMREFIFGQRYLTEKGEILGGDGSPEAMRSGMGMINPRINFKTTAYFNAKLITTNGKSVTVEFLAPDNLSTYRIMAIAQTKNSSFGYGDTEVTVNKPLMLLSTLPSFVRRKDSLLAGAMVYNYTGSDQKITLSLDSDSKSVRFGFDRTNFQLSNGKSTEIRFPLLVLPKSRKSLKLTIKAKAGHYTDGLEKIILVKNPRIYESLAIYGKTEKSEKQKLNVSDNVIPEWSKLDFNLSPSAFSELKGSVDALIEYPYGCLEQKSSRILPLILGQDVILKLKLLDQKTPKELHKLVQTTLSEFPKYWGANGFHYWTDSSSWGDPYLTIYTTFVMTMANSKGYKLPVRLLPKALERVNNYTDGRGYFKNPYFEYSKYYKALVQSYALYVSALNQHFNLSELKRALNYLDEELKNSLSSYAYLLKTLNLYPDFDQKTVLIEKIREKLLESARVESGMVYFTGFNSWDSWFYYGSTISTAVILQAIEETPGTFEDGFKVIRWLIAQQNHKTASWNQTHENAMAFWAMNTYLEKYEKDNPDYTAKIALNSKEVLKAMFKSRLDPVVRKEVSLQKDTPQDSELTISKEGKGWLYYLIRYRYVLKNYPNRRDNGFSIEKQWLDYDTKKPVQDFERGKRYIIKLIVTTPKIRHFAVVDDPLPAGFEPVNLDFATEANENNVREGSDRWWGTFSHREKYRDRVIFTADYLEPGTHTLQYVVRAVTAGTFAIPQVKAEEMYHPEVFGYVSQKKMTVKN